VGENVTVPAEDQLDVSANARTEAILMMQPTMVIGQCRYVVSAKQSKTVSVRRPLAMFSKS
jgi:hypothetical protein